MKTKALLIASVMINLALAAALLFRGKPSSETPGEPSVPASTPKSSVQPTTAASSKQLTVTNLIAQSFDWRVVESEDYRKYIANLRAIGCPEETIRDIIVADVNKLFEARRRESTASTNKFEFWKTGNPLAGMIDTARLEKSQQLNTEKRALLKELLGSASEEKPDLLGALGGLNPFESMLDFLSPSKQTQVADIYAKFQTRMLKNIGEGGAEDLKEMQNVQKEMEVEMAAILTPKEYEDYQLRMSQTAMMMRAQLGSFEPNEQEFREIFKARKAFDDEFGLVGLAMSSASEREKRSAAEKQVNAQVREVLGETRYAEYERAQDPQYQMIYRVTQRHDLLKLSATQVFEMKRVAEEHARNVRTDGTLSEEQRTVALATIRQESEKAVSDVLGPAATEAYSKSGGQWMRRITDRPASTTQPIPRP